MLVGKIIEADLFESVSVGNNPSDAGGSIGSAFFLLHSKNEKIDLIQKTTFLGPGYNNEYIKKNIIDKIQEENKYNIKFYENFDDLAAKAALIIKKDKVIFYFEIPVNDNDEIITLSGDYDLNNFQNNKWKGLKFYKIY